MPVPRVTRTASELRVPCAGRPTWVGVAPITSGLAVPRIARTTVGLLAHFQPPFRGEDQYGFSSRCEYVGAQLRQVMEWPERYFVRATPAQRPRSRQNRATEADTKPEQLLPLLLPNSVGPVVTRWCHVVGPGKNHQINQYEPGQEQNR